MKRQKDTTLITCRLCLTEVPASGIPSHLRYKHVGYDSEKYVTEFGEFRASKLKQELKLEKSTIKCQICQQVQVSHKQLLHHLKGHNIKWQNYYVTYYFNGKHPLCSCGCKQKVTLIKHGKLDNGTPSFARTMLPGHHRHDPGYRQCTHDQKMKMRQSAIKRLQDTGRYYTSNSSYETLIVQYLKTELNISNIEINNKSLLSGHEIDIYCPDQKIGIEINGSYFHSDVFKKRNYHLKKTEECSALGIRLVHLWEPDIYKNLDIVKSNLANLLGRTAIRIYGRYTEIREVPSSEANVFLNENHLQGSCPSKVKIGLYYKDELVSIMTFGSLRKVTGMQAKEGAYELLRFCNKLNTSTVGGASKLYTYFINTYNPKSIISYANRDWSTGNLYEKLGMSFDGFTPPGYFYVKSRIKYSRFAFRKQELIKKGADPSETEFQIMDKLGYSRIWNCGNYRYSYTFLPET